MSASPSPPRAPRALLALLALPLALAGGGCGPSEALPSRSRALPSFSVGGARVRLVLRLEGRATGTRLDLDGHHPSERREWIREEPSVARRGRSLDLWDARRSARSEELRESPQLAARALSGASLTQCVNDEVAAYRLTLPGLSPMPWSLLYVRGGQAVLMEPEGVSQSESGGPQERCEAVLGAAGGLEDRLVRAAAAGRARATEALVGAGFLVSGLRLSLLGRRAPTIATRRALREAISEGRHGALDLEAELFALLAPDRPEPAQLAAAQELLAYAPTPSRRRALAEQILLRCTREPLCEEWRARFAGRVVEEQRDPDLCDAAHRVAGAVLSVEGIDRAKVGRWLLIPSLGCGAAEPAVLALRRALDRPSLGAAEGSGRAVHGQCAPGRALDACPSLPRAAAAALAERCEDEDLAWARAQLREPPSGVGALREPRRDAAHHLLARCDPPALEAALAGLSPALSAHVRVRFRAQLRTQVRPPPGR